VAVREQYEAHPYPRWQWPAHRGCEPLRAVLARLLPGFAPPAWVDSPVDVLVAGTGTGRHAISVALRYENARVVGTDLSRASLAYAMRMAGALGVGNVRFVQNDLLGLGALGRRFHVIECVGVLHHMADSMAGLRALVAALVPDGLLKLGFYSARARAPVRAAQATVARLGLAPDAKGIRALREMALASPQGDPLHALLEMPDFYGMSACRDLLFHAHERHFDLGEVEAMLEGADLELLGFESSDPRLLAEYRRRFPDDPAGTDLGSWQVFEREQPDAFLSMYQFWCRPTQA
jgi:SAM-dependent methyltransferase